MYLGDEAVLDLDRFSLQGRAVRVARQSSHRARRAGYTATVRRTADLDAGQVAALRALSARWRGEAAERGFSMALGRLFDPRDPATVVVVGHDADGRPRGFLHFVPWDGDGASLDAMRRDRDAPSWLNDFLVVEAARQLPALGIRRLSLNFSFLRAVVAAGAEADVPLRLRAARWALGRLSGPFQIQTLYRFNKKFAPQWYPRYLAVEALEELPRVAFACLRAEGLLPAPRLPRRRRGAARPAGPAPLAVGGRRRGSRARRGRGGGHRRSGQRPRSGARGRGGRPERRPPDRQLRARRPRHRRHRPARRRTGGGALRAGRGEPRRP
jgi:lysyl-tRNA synthetase class 2